MGRGTKASAGSISCLVAGTLALLGAATIATASERDDEIISFHQPIAWQPEEISAGEKAYVSGCVNCHGADLSGGLGPALKGPTFEKTWNGRTVGAMAKYIANTMPADDPGSLSPKASEDLVAFMLTRIAKDRAAGS